MKKLCLLYLFLLLVTACEKTEGITQEEAAAVSVTVRPIPNALSLDELSITLKDGIPQYIDTDHFLQAKKSIYQSSHQAYLSWAEREGLNSLYAKFDKFAQRVDNNPGIPARTQINFNKESSLLTTDAGGVFLHPALPFPKLTDHDSRMFIGDDLHYFTPDYHLVIDGGNLLQLEQFRKEPTHDPANGVILEFTKGYPEDSEGFGNFNPSAKVSFDLFECPLNFTDSDDPIRNIPDNVRILRNIDWSPGIYQAFRHKYDEQRYRCAGRRCREGTKGYLIGLSMITEINGTASFRMISSVEHKYENRRRTLWNWIRTFPNNRFERDPTRFTMAVQFRGLAVRNISETTVYTDNTEVSYPTTTAQNAAYNGSAHGEWVLAERNLVIKNALPFTQRFKADILITDGRTRHRWINRGDINNPMAPTFGCPH